MNMNAAKEIIISELKAEHATSSTSPKRMREIIQEIIQLRCEIINSKDK